MSVAPSSNANESTPSVFAAVAVGDDGVLMSIICTPSSTSEATSA